jgi:nitrate reductase NapE component
MTATANGHRLEPLTIRPAGPVSPWPQDDNPGQDRTPPGKPGWWRTDGTVFIVVALFAVAQVAVVAFSGSWQHQYELSIHLGQAHWVAGMQPLSVEGLIVSATLVIWYAGRHGYRRREVWGAYLVLAAGVGQTVLMNLGADYRWPWLGPEISVWPAVAFVAAYEMAVWLVRKRQDVARRAEDDSDTLPVTPAVTPPPVTPARDKPPARPRKPVPAAQAKAKPPSVADVIRDNPGLTNAELAALAGCKVRTIQRHKPRSMT